MAVNARCTTREGVYNTSELRQLCGAWGLMHRAAGGIALRRPGLPAQNLLKLELVAVLVLIVAVQSVQRA
jgi:hypothetical protein